VSVFGHGQTKPFDPNDPLSSYGDALAKGDMKIIDEGSRNQQLAGLVDAGSVVCAQGTGTTVCSGDSGGPLLEYTRELAEPGVRFGHPGQIFARLVRGVRALQGGRRRWSHEVVMTEPAATMIH
jgi:hypothetical protein